MTGKELAAACPLFYALRDYYCVMSLRRRGIYKTLPVVKPNA